MLYELKVDQYSATRGGQSEVVQIFCTCCGAHLFDYQKDGQGFIHRGYYDRVLGPTEMVARFHLGTSEIAFTCVCGVVFGTPMVYLEERRPAIDFTPGGIIKRWPDGSEYEPPLEPQPQATPPP